MNKRSQWILILSLLLCLMILFVSCDQGDTSKDAETTITTTNSETESVTETTTAQETTTEEPTPDNESVDYASIISKWNQYIEYAEPETVPQYTLEQLFADKDSNTARVDVNMHHEYMATVRTTYSSHNDLGEVISRSYKYEIYNLATANKILTLTTESYDPNAENEYSRLSPTTYNIRFVCDAYGQFTGIIEVKKGVLTVIEVPLQAEYHYFYSYSYYDTNGNSLKTELEEPCTVSFLYDDQTALVTAGDKCYVSRGGEIIFSCDKGQERVIPRFDTEYKGFKYVFTDERLVIYDAEYNRVVDYHIAHNSDVSRQGFMVLGNGDVLIEQIVECGYYEDDFDYEAEDEYVIGRYKVNHVIVSAATGKATAIDFDFIIEAFAGQTTDGGRGIKLKSEAHQYAEIRKFADGKLSSDTEFLILDNSLATVESLPKIVKNQTSICEFVDASHIIVEATTPVGNALYYFVDTSAKNVRPYYDVRDDADYQSIKGGYVYNDILYNNDNTQLYDLRNAISYYIEGKEILYVVEQYGLEGDTLAYDKNGNPMYPADGIVRIKIMHIDSTKNISEQSMVVNANDIYHNSDGFYYSNADGYTVWDKYGNQILDADVTGFVEIADNCYLVTCRKTVSEYVGGFDGYVEVTYTEYYIMK